MSWDHLSVRGGPKSIRGSSVGQISPPSVKKYFLGQKGTPLFNTRGPSVDCRTICRSEGPPFIRRSLLSVRGGTPSTRGSLCRPDKPFVGQKNIFLVRGPSAV